MKKHTISLMTGISLTAAALALGLSGCGASASGGSDDNSLYVYNWGEYIDESVIDQFEEETGISVSTTYSRPMRRCTRSSRRSRQVRRGLSLRLYDPEDAGKWPSGGD